MLLGRCPPSSLKPGNARGPSREADMASPSPYQVASKGLTGGARVRRRRGWQRSSDGPRARYADGPPSGGRCGPREARRGAAFPGDRARTVEPPDEDAPGLQDSTHRWTCTKRYIEQYRGVRTTPPDRSQVPVIARGKIRPRSCSLRLCRMARPSREQVAQEEEDQA
jgi:hypothetical protein